MDHFAYCDLLVDEIEACAVDFERADPSAAVPSCPEWTVADLATHLGGIHRWAEALVRDRAVVRKTLRELGGSPDERPTPDDEAATWAAWLRAGGRRLIATLREADPDAPMWAWGADQHVRFWSRRQVHETMVHRWDAALASLGRLDASACVADPAVAVDGVDEFLENLPIAVYFRPAIAKLRGAGSLHLHATDAPGEWMIRMHDDGFEVTSEHAKGDVAVRGPAAALLAVLTGRATPDDLECFGDRELLDRWLRDSAF